MKRCFVCKKRKPLTEFYVHPQMADGHLGKCKECIKAKLRADRLDLFQREKVLIRDNNRSKTLKRKAQVLETQRRRRAKYPEKYFARQWVSNALRYGRLQRKPCESCGAEKAQAHHEDYNKFDQVRWLCFKCHREQMHNQKVGAR